MAADERSVSQVTDFDFLSAQIRVNLRPIYVCHTDSQTTRTSATHSESDLGFCCGLGWLDARRHGFIYLRAGAGAGFT